MKNYTKINLVRFLNLKNKIVMTKEERIKEAWGDLYQYSDDNGWISFAFGITRSLKDSDLDKSRINDKLVIRPKSLKGIENNNGWVKIENENNLPSIF